VTQGSVVQRSLKSLAQLGQDVVPPTVITYIAPGTQDTILPSV